MVNAHSMFDFAILVSKQQNTMFKTLIVQ